MIFAALREVLQLLLGGEAKKRVETEDGVPAVRVAALNHQLLLEAGFDNIAGKQNAIVSPCAAAERPHLEMVRMFL